MLIFSKDKDLPQVAKDEDAAVNKSTPDAADIITENLSEEATDTPTTKKKRASTKKKQSQDTNLDKLSNDIGEIFSEDTTKSKPTLLDAILCDSRFILVVSFLSIFVGFVKFVSPISGIPVFGDFLPFVAGFAAGLSLIIEYLMTNTSLTFPSAVETIFIDGKKFIGFFCVLVALLHFICPNVVLF